ncbi:MAG TPA: hypothetical protein P5075_12150 [Eubacteriales bacterium]|nr:hypothetical protein [Eubacteriales bacterium]
MTEHEFFAMSVQRYIVDSGSVRNKACLAAKKRRHGGTRVLFPIAACFVCILIAVACIPKARAEVLSWFGWSTTPEDYLGKESQARESAERVDALITEADPGETDAAVTDKGDFDRVSALLADRLNVSLSEALYDGDSVYVTMNLGGGFGVWLLENYTGGSTASVAIPPEKLGDFFSPTVPDSFLSGEDVYYSHTTGRLIMTLPDGTSLCGSVCIADGEALSALLAQTGGNPRDVDALVENYLIDNDVKAYAVMKANPERLAALAGEDGCIEGVFSLLLQIELDGSMRAEPTTVLQADIGRMPVDVTTFQTFTQTVSGNPETMEWSGETILTYFDDSDVDESMYGYNVYTNHVLSLDGLKMKAQSVQMDATGIKKLQVDVTYPDGWSDEEIHAFSGRYGVFFQLLINGEEGDWSVNGNMRSFDTTGPRERVWYCRSAFNVPLGLLPEIKELTLIPYIGHLTAYYELGPDQNGEMTVRGTTTPLLLDRPFSLWNDFSGDFDQEVTYYPQYALTFAIPQAAGIPGE